MAVLSLSDRQRLEWVVRYLQNGGGGRKLDDKAASELAKVFQSRCGFNCHCGAFQQQLKVAPVLTLLRSILCETEGLVVPAVTGEIIVTNNVAGVFLGSLCSYGVVAGQSVTNTGATLVNGDLGLFPGTSVTGFPPGVVTGTQHINDAAAIQAQAELVGAYNDAASRIPTEVFSVEDIGGQTIFPGVYKSNAGLAISGGMLILDGRGDINGTWIFQIGSTLTVTSGRQIILINGAQANNVFFQVGSSATLGTGSIVKGTIMALTSITAATGVNTEGRLLARNGSVTLDTNNIAAPTC